MKKCMDPGAFNEANVQFVGLGLTKASHEFLMLHYFATDSAQIWDDLDATHELVFPHALARRAHAYQALLASHVAPSYRRMPHPLWTSCLTLILRLCLESARSHLAYFLGVPHVKPTHHEPLSRALAGEAPTSQCPVPVQVPQSNVPITPRGVVKVWGFSAGSFTGLALLDIVATDPHIAIEGTFGALACPPALMARFPSRLAKCIRIYHYAPDQLCCWELPDHEVSASQFQVVLVRNYDNNMDRHFGKSEHSYSHWLWLEIAPGVYKLWALCEGSQTQNLTTNHGKFTWSDPKQETPKTTVTKLPTSNVQSVSQHQALQWLHTAVVCFTTHKYQASCLAQHVLVSCLVVVSPA